jgi:hypothetical protein
VQALENYSESDDDKQLSLITHIAVESADQHDVTAHLPAKFIRAWHSLDQLFADSL